MCVCATLAVVLLVPASAGAQYRPQAPVNGETYSIELAAAYWNPTAEIVAASDGLGLTGTSIDFKNELGLADHRLPQFQIVLRLARKHKARFQYIPITYDSTATLPRDVIFNGVTFAAGTTVTSSLAWKAYRVGYEYDFLVRSNGFAGFIVEVKQTDFQERLTNANANEARRTKVPVPAIGGIVRVYPMESFSLTGELSGFKLPTSPDRKFGGHYVEIDGYATVALTTKIGVQVGYRRIDIGHYGESDSGTLKMKGFYLGGVVRY